MKHALLSAAAGALAATLIAGGVAWATIPTAGVINACYRVSEDDQKGQVRVVTDPTSCKNNEAPISWNQKGLDGAPGPQGAACLPTNAACVGPKGDKGDPGNDGTDGIDGVPGTNGTNGTDGVSVTSAAEDPGANCANGGSKFTATNGTTYACNGAPGPAGNSLPQAYTTSAWDFVVFGGSLNGVIILARSVPAGSYVVDATAYIVNEGSTSNTAFCRIEGASGTFTADVNVPADTTSHAVPVSVPSVVVTLAVAGQIKLICDSSSNVNRMETGRATLTAVAVAPVP